MGYFSSTKKQETTYQPKTAEDLSTDDLMKEIYLSSVELAGYEYTTVKKTKYENPADEQRALSLKNQLAARNEELTKLQASYDAVAKKPAGAKTPTDVAAEASLKTQLSRKQAQVNNIDSQINSIKMTEYDDYDMTKKEDPRVKQAIYDAANKATGGQLSQTIATYGEDSAEVKAITDKYKTDPTVVSVRDEVTKEESELTSQEADLNKNFLTAINKLVTGDISADPKTKADLEEYYAPISKVISSTVDDLLKQQSDNDTDIGNKLQALNDQIDQTGYDAMSFLEGAQVQLEASGKTLIDTANELNSKTEAKAKFEYDLLNKKAEKQVAAESALLGEPPNSERAKRRLAQLQSDNLNNVLLSQEVSNADRIFNITAATESGKNEIALKKFDLATTQGSKKEAAAKLGFDWAADSGKTKLGIKSAGANEALNLEKAKSDALFGVSYGNLATAIGAGSSGLNFGAKSNAFTSGLLGTAGGQLSSVNAEEANARAGQATTTQSSSSSVFSNLLDAATTGVSSATGLKKAFW